jgi:hypothetical protein
MCKRCANLVQSMLKSCGRAYILCADNRFSTMGVWISGWFSTVSTHNHTLSLSTSFLTLSPLLKSVLSTSSTVPIIRTNNV